MIIMIILKSRNQSSFVYPTYIEIFSIWEWDLIFKINFLFKNILK
jgi:hypothetical protein